MDILDNESEGDEHRYKFILTSLLLLPVRAWANTYPILDMEAIKKDAIETLEEIWAIAPIKDVSTSLKID